MKECDSRKDTSMVEKRYATGVAELTTGDQLKELEQEKERYKT